MSSTLIVVVLFVLVLIFMPSRRRRHDRYYLDWKHRSNPTKEEVAKAHEFARKVMSGEIKTRPLATKEEMAAYRKKKHGL